jgi:hypothetical protein
MPDKENLEIQIRRILDAEQDAISLSNKLFSPEGLFHQLAPTEAERRNLVKLPLFKQAQRRLSDLKRSVASEFARTVEQFEAGRQATPSLHRIERV